MNRIFSQRTLGTLVAVAASWLNGGVAAAAPAKIGQVIEPFTLTDSAGAKRSLDDWKDAKAVVVVFLGTECPLAKMYGRRLAEMDEKYGPQGVQIVGVNSNQQDTMQELAAYGHKHGVKFPLLKDPGARVADQFGATRTPEAFVLDAHGAVRYRGRIDDQFAVGSARKEAKKSELVDAIEAVVAGKSAPTPVTQAVGCLIGRREPNQSASSGEVTYAKQVSRLMQERCVGCHRAGQIAPFTLTEYEDVVAWSDMMLEVIDQNRMPPWQANPKYGEFHNDARLTDEEKKLFRQWVAGGAPEGDPKDLPAPREFVDGWQIPKPDVVFKMPEAFEVPATGAVQYQHIYIDPGFTEDKWVRAAEARPGNREVVHHLILFYIPPGQDRHHPQDPLVNAIAAFAPGMPPMVAPEEYAIRIPAGSKLAFQVHYTPNGSPQTDLSEAGLVFADPDKVAKEIHVDAGINPRFLIPPGEPDYVVRAKKKFDRDVLLYSLTPHMHYRGKSFRFTATYPDNSEEILLDVPRYDFNWQIVYLLKQPKLLPAGSRIDLVAHYDNSADNPLNPDPTQAVYWGDQTWEEMMLGTFAISHADQDLRIGPPRVEMVRQATDDDAGEYRVRFRFRPNPGDRELPGKVDTVHLGGDFNEWNATKHPLEGPDEEGFYVTEVDLGAGRYEYKFVVNGKIWKPDPGAREMTKEYGNSILHIE